MSVGVTERHLDETDQDLKSAPGSRGSDGALLGVANDIKLTRQPNSLIEINNIFETHLRF